MNGEKKSLLKKWLFPALLLGAALFMYLSIIFRHVIGY